MGAGIHIFKDMLFILNGTYQLDIKKQYVTDVFQYG